MALLQVTKNIGNDPGTMKALYAAFTTVEEIEQPGTVESLIKIFKVTGQGVPASDTLIEVDFGTPLGSPVTKVLVWRIATVAPEIKRSDMQF